MPQLERSIIDAIEVISPVRTCPSSLVWLVDWLDEDTDRVVYLPPDILDADFNALIGNCSPDKCSDGLKLRARFVLEVITTQTS